MIPKSDAPGSGCRRKKLCIPVPSLPPAQQVIRTWSATWGSNAPRVATVAMAGDPTFQSATRARHTRAWSYFAGLQGLSSPSFRLSHPLSARISRGLSSGRKRMRGKMRQLTADKEEQTSGLLSLPRKVSAHVGAEHRLQPPVGTPFLLTGANPSTPLESEQIGDSTIEDFCASGLVQT